MSKLTFYYGKCIYSNEKLNQFMGKNKVCVTGLQNPRSFNMPLNKETNPGLQYSSLYSR